MSETKTPGDKKIGVGKTLTLKPRTETGVVRQSFSHGRSKQVVVETVKRRTVGKPVETKAAEPAAAGSAEEGASAGRPRRDARSRGARAEIRRRASHADR